MNEITVKKSDFLSESYTKIKHSSGLDIYVIKKKLTTAFALFGTRYGSVDNVFRLKDNNELTEVPNGIAHFLEHKLFENEDGPDTFERYAKTGANANAYTTFDKTAYLFSCTENFEASLEILLDFVTKPYFTEQTVQKEQGIIGQEIKMGEDNPSRVLFFNLMESLYEKNPVRISIAGTVGSIKKINADLLYKCYNTFYNLNNMALVICGDVDVDNVVRVADKVLKKADKCEIERVFPEEKRSVFQKEKTAKMQVSKPLFDIGIKDTDIPEKPFDRVRKCIGMDIVSDILFGKGSKIYNELYDEGLISPDFEFDYSLCRYFGFCEMAGESKDPYEVYSRIKKYIKECQKEKLDIERFERSRKVVLAEFVKCFDSTEEIAGEFMDYLFEDFDIFDYPEAVKSVTPEYVSELIRKMFDDECFALSVVFPVEKED